MINTDGMGCQKSGNPVNLVAPDLSQSVASLRIGSSCFAELSAVRRRRPSGARCKPRSRSSGSTPIMPSCSCRTDADDMLSNTCS